MAPSAVSASEVTYFRPVAAVWNFPAPCGRNVKVDTAPIHTVPVWSTRAAVAPPEKFQSAPTCLHCEPSKRDSPVSEAAQMRPWWSLTSDLTVLGGRLFFWP